MSTFDVPKSKNLDSGNDDVFSFRNPPVSTELSTKVKGLEFDEAFSRAIFQPFIGIKVRMIDVRDLIAAKKAANRDKDNDDLEHLES